MGKSSMLRVASAASTAVLGAWAGYVVCRRLADWGKMRSPDSTAPIVCRPPARTALTTDEVVDQLLRSIGLSMTAGCD